MKIKNEDTKKILDKLFELKSAFQFGEKMVPLIQNITNFMQEIVPLLQNVNVSINESNQKFPIAQNQIENITSATELATTEILDQIDEAGNSLNNISQYCAELNENKNQQTELFEKLSDALKDKPEEKQILDALLKVSDYTKSIEKINAEINTLNDKNFQITMSLQVQDITSQQLAAVKHLINSVHEKLEILISDLETSNISEDFLNLYNKEYEQESDRDKDFNANASYAKDDRQEKADKVVNEIKNVNNDNDDFSQDDIDKLFSG